MPIAHRSKADLSGAAPAQKTYGRKRCKNCNAMFTRTKPNAEFCKVKKDGTPSNCKNEFHHNRSAFGPLKGRIEGFIREQTRDLRKKVAELEKVVIALQNGKPDQPSVLQLRGTIDHSAKICIGQDQHNPPRPNVTADIRDAKR
jgi:hypothetical protein